MQPVASITADQELTVDDLLYTQYASSIAISPDGSHLAWVMTGHAQDTEIESYNLFIIDLADKSTRQVTDYADTFVLSPQWSLEGSSLAFLSNAPLPGEEGPGDSLQVWVTRLDAAAPRPVTRQEGGVEDFDWRGPDRIIYYARESGGDSSGANDDTVHVSDYTEAPANLYQVGREGGGGRKAQRLLR
jgi:Tol biopolymer transport system component